MKKRDINSTDCVHSGTEPDSATFSLNPPVVHSAPFSFPNTASLVAFAEGRSDRTQAEYGRMSNPTVKGVEKRLAALEGAEQAQLFGSGMSAVTTMLLALLGSGDHILLTSDSYRRTRDFGVFLAKFGIEMTVVAPTADAIEQGIQTNTKLVFTEIPTNPYLRCVDLEKVVAITRKPGILVVADSTFATPINLRPLDLGVDLVIHSATKYFGGHNDLIAGVMAGPERLIQPISELLMTLGGICDPNTAFLLGRGLKTLSLRVARQNDSGQRVAEFLEGHPRIEKVFYPGLPSHPDHGTAERLMKGFGGVVTFLVDGDFDATARFIDRLEIPRIAPSLGGVESLIEQVAIMGFWNLPREERESLGIPDNLVRIALGIEEPEDLIADLTQALSAS
ncbi:MAG: aminotransferase class I/II-fold pyridoxal phosphate-dependent enzyme [Acidobacteriota bacterium]|nr:MAG: aminotransferase class I/II-fold pyridoxal phosphate-dependent enzyme [Acidobacteriota bacterium]